MDHSTPYFLYSVLAAGSSASSEGCGQHISLAVRGVVHYASTTPEHQSWTGRARLGWGWGCSSTAAAAGPACCCVSLHRSGTKQPARLCERGGREGGKGTRAGDAKSCSGGPPLKAAACLSMLDLLVVGHVWLDQNLLTLVRSPWRKVNSLACRSPDARTLLFGQPNARLHLKRSFAACTCAPARGVQTRYE